MTQSLVLENMNGQIVRNMPWLLGDKAFVVRRFDSGRIEMHADLSDMETDGYAFEILKEVNRSELEKGPVKLGEQNQLRLVRAIENPIYNEEELVEDKNTFRISVGVASLVAAGFLSYVLTHPQEEYQALNMVPVKVEEVVKIHKNIRPQQVKLVQNPMTAQNTQTVKTPTQAVKAQSAVKRMGALGALGSLKNSKQNGGLNLGQVNSTRGPGLGGTGGSGGVQKSLYGKGLVSAPLGEGGNLKGGGGYGTHGKGGGQAGYGSLSLVGSAGGSPIPLGREAIIEGGLDRDLIAAVVERNSGQVRFCYEQGLQGDPNLAGRVVLEWTITGNGAVEAAGVQNTSLHSKIVEDCIVARLRGWKFPLPPNGSSVKVAFPFMLQRRG